jgi:Domain of unknown function (DUF4281)
MPMAQNLFNLLNLLPMPLWLGMILFPRTKYTQRLVMSYWYFIALAAVYVVFIIVSLFQGGGFSFTFDGIRQGLSSEWGFLVAWAHFITLDLFTGVWIFRDAKYYGINPILFLIVTLFAGPLGLMIYLLVRQRRSKQDPVRTLN